MKKNNYIALILFVVFSFVLMHTIIPHHHHDEVAEINNHQHHHQDNNEKDHHNENDEPIGLFSHSTHVLVSAEFVFHAENSSQKIQTHTQAYQTSDLILTSTIVSIKRKPPNYISVVPLQLFYSAHSLRGPPAISV